MTPVDAYYGKNLQTLSIYATKEFTRAAIGGTGHVKAAANYAQSLYAAKKPRKKAISRSCGWIIKSINMSMKSVP